MAPSILVTRSADETFQAGREFASRLEEGDVVALFGPLGGGKTTFVKGVAAGLKAKDAVTSPTFVLLNVYSGKIPLYHFDFYRLEQAAQLEALNLEDFLYGKGVCLIEWPELALPLLDRPFYKVRFEINDENERKIEIGGKG
ncbi:MAG TPA: tRNA (adenosine(37)-N6)-threonylcarbamoyltransferase complex ATPase subunit type 1 TsaE [Verrucomicrobiae bacterium]|nr:tRNA (adenosine(37)-N6)-threonylcarbamoyltransferase complex ATPase subunit type 1 TsaE [Verrucomicrobiae bacterium]